MDNSLYKKHLANSNTYEFTVHSPGRINLIGEHTDYNNGFVLPAAIDKTIDLRFRRNGSSNECCVYSKQYNSTFIFKLDELPEAQNPWERFVIGVVSELKELSESIKGFDCFVDSYLPIGSGVSSSAAFECGLATGLNELFELGLNEWDIIKLSQRAEHNFVGTQCGIMDQFASVLGKVDHAMFLDCKTLEFEYIPMSIRPYCLLLLNTNVDHELSSGGYNNRRNECEAGLDVLKEHFEHVSTLRDVTKEMLDSCAERMDSTVYKRCSYVIEENQRVLEAVEALKNDDLGKFGDLMYKTHTGLSEKYEVSCPELDFLVEFSRTESRLLGSRMMGGGFGGCTLNIIHSDAVESFVQDISKAYYEQFKIQLSSFQAVPSKGTYVTK
ncbi:MAG: galactokinase [Flagellimonas sp.]